MWTFPHLYFFIKNILTFLKNYYNILVLKKKGGYNIKGYIKSSQDWLLFDKILEDGILVSNNKYIKIIKVLPINYELKSDLEKEAILNSYKLFLKVCDFDIQILIQSRKENLDSYISQINKQSNEEQNEKISKISNLYIEYIQNQNKLQNSSSKNFYILISSQIENSENEFNIKQVREDLNSKYLKIKDSLSRCGNLIFDVNTRESAEKIVYSFYNFRKTLNFL